MTAPRWGVRLVLLLAAVLGTGCSRTEPASKALPGTGQEAGAPVTGDWLRIAYQADPQSLNFVRAQDNLGKLLAQYISDTLVQYDARLQIVGRLAESWSFSPDHRVLTFHMRRGARWQDGEPVTSADAAYTAERIRDPRSQAVSRYSVFEPVERIETPDEWTLRVTYREPFATELDAWTDAPLIPRHLYEKERDFLDNPQSRAPIGCGPFRFVSWKEAQEIVLEANETYWAGRPYLDRFIIKIIPQDSTRMQALQLGEIDYLSMTPQQVVAEAKGPEFEKRFRRLTYTLPYLFYIGWNMDGSNPFFTDRRVRQAMTYALDRPGYLRTVWHGLAVPAATHITPDSWAYATEVKPYRFDPDKARLLLDEAGWRDSDGDGVRDKDGRPFAFTLLYAATGKMNDDMAASFQENLRQVGVKMELAKVEFKTFMQRLQGHRFEASMSSLNLDPDPDPYDLFHSGQIRSGSNRVSYSNPEMDRLCEEGRREFDREARRRIYARIQQLLSEEQPFTFISHPTVNVALDRRFRGVEISPLGLYLFWPGMARWWVPEAEQRFPRSRVQGR